MQSVIKLFALSLALSTTVATAETAAGTTASEKTAAPRRPFALELKPAPLLLNAIPNQHGIAVGAEMAIDDHVSAFGELGYLGLHLNDKQVKDIVKDDKDRTTVRDVTSLGMAFGGRYYIDSATADSWYAGGRLTVSKSDAKWVSGDEKIADKGYALAPGVEGGYRWIWNNGLLVRLGAGGNVTAYQKHSVDSSLAMAKTPGEKEVEKAGNKRFAPILDLGLGYAF